MDITRRLLGVSALQEPHKVKAVGVDLNGMIRRLLLFDTYILKSIRLQEFPFLVALVGYDGTMELLGSKAFEIQCESVTIGQAGHASDIGSGAVKGPLPPLSYRFFGIDAADRQKYVHNCLQPLHDMSGLKRVQLRSLKLAIVNKLRRPPGKFAKTVVRQGRNDIVGKPHLVRKSVQLVLERELGAIPDAFELRVRELDDEDLLVETDLHSKFGIEIDVAHRVIERGLLGVCGLAHRFLEMEAHSAINGFLGDDLVLVHEQLNSLARSISPQYKERQFTRVMEIAGFPDFTASCESRRVNIAKLLEVRESEECKQFREWLTTAGDASDKEIQDQLGDLRSRVGNVLDSNVGKAVRFITATGLSFVPGAGTVAEIALSAVDSFILDRLFPRNGIVSFVSSLYPSIFEKKEE